MNDFILHRLVKVLDMMRDLERASQQPWATGSGDMRVPPETINVHVQPRIVMLRGDCEFLEIAPALQLIDNQLRVKLRDGISYAELESKSKVLREIIDNDLTLRRFAYVPDTKARVLDSFQHEWHEAIAAIPGATPDIKAAVEAYALDLNTACVFHLMRVAELGLRRLATRLKVKITHTKQIIPLEYGEWDKIITAIKNKIAGFRSLPTGPKRQQQLEMYSDAADHCGFMKDIWRNSVSHTRKSYSTEDALAAMVRVRDFMNFLARCGL